MLGKVFGLKKKNVTDAVAKGFPTADTSIAPITNVSKMLNTSGRISPQLLHKMAEISKKPEFIRFIRQPVLIGSSIQAGSFSGSPRTSGDEMNRTIIFEMDAVEDETCSSETLKHAIYPLVKSEYGRRARTTFSVGRVDGNDMIMADLAISKQHASFEIKGGDYLIRDQGSTNGTTLNGKRVEKKPMKIRDGDIVGFARYEFTVVFPESLYNLLKNS